MWAEDGSGVWRNRFVSCELIKLQEAQVRINIPDEALNTSSKSPQTQFQHFKSLLHAENLFREILNSYKIIYKHSFYVVQK